MRRQLHRAHPPPERPALEAGEAPKRKKRAGDDSARRAGLLLGRLIGLLGAGVLAVATAGALVVAGVFDRARPDETAKADEPEKQPDPKPEPKPEPKNEIKPRPKPEPKAPEPGPEPPVESKVEPPAGGGNVPPKPKLPRPNPGDPSEAGPIPPDLVDPVPPPIGRPDRPPIRPPGGKLSFPAPAAVELKPAPLERDAAEVKLPGKIADAVVGGGGRYWCLLLGRPEAGRGLRRQPGEGREVHSARQWHHVHRRRHE